MATYIMLSRLSPEGVKTLKSNPDRLSAVNHEVEALGAKVLSQYALLGEYDFITVLEAPNPASYQTMAALPVDTFIASLKKR